jgi:50S ribosomal subunit-associated GTPase HflX
LRKINWEIDTHNAYIAKIHGISQNRTINPYNKIEKVEKQTQKDCLSRSAQIYLRMEGEQLSYLLSMSFYKKYKTSYEKIISRVLQEKKKLISNICSQYLIQQESTKVTKILAPIVHRSIFNFSMFSLNFSLDTKLLT